MCRQILNYIDLKQSPESYSTTILLQYDKLQRIINNLINTQNVMLSLLETCIKQHLTHSDN